MVGEMRDLETAQIAIQASLTGHLVLSTLHTNDSAGAVTRLVDMGVEPFLVAATLEGVLAQRLLRTICKGCRAHLTTRAFPSSISSAYRASDLGGKNSSRAAAARQMRQHRLQRPKGIYELSTSQTRFVI
jgi:type IV pilus assembly protein PilB